MTELSKVDANVSSLRDLYPEIVQKQAETNQPIRTLNLHCNRISQIERDVVHALVGLVYLDLSSNELESLKGLEALGGLRCLNVANNKISRLTDLAGLYSLRWLCLQYNSIEQLDGFVEFHGNHYCLEYLDIIGNKISNLDQIKYLAGCAKLKHLILQEEMTGNFRINPVCPPQNASNEEKTKHRGHVFKRIPQLMTLDGLDNSGVKVEMPLEPGISGFEDYDQFLSPNHSVIDCSLIEGKMQVDPTQNKSDVSSMQVNSNSANLPKPNPSIPTNKENHQTQNPPSQHDGGQDENPGPDRMTQEIQPSIIHIENLLAALLARGLTSSQNQEPDRKPAGTDFNYERIANIERYMYKLKSIMERMCERKKTEDLNNGRPHKSLKGMDYDISDLVLSSDKDQSDHEDEDTGSGFTEPVVFTKPKEKLGNAARTPIWRKLNANNFSENQCKTEEKQQKGTLDVEAEKENILQDKKKQILDAKRAGDNQKSKLPKMTSTIFRLRDDGNAAKAKGGYPPKSSKSAKGIPEGRTFSPPSKHPSLALLDSLQEEQDRLRAREADMVIREGDLMEENESGKEKISALTVKCAELERKVQELHMNRDVLGTRVTTAEAALEASSNRIAQLEAENTSMRHSCQEYKTSLEQERDKGTGLAASAKILEKQLQKISDDGDAERQNIRTLENSLATLQGTLKSVEDERAKLGLRLIKDRQQAKYHIEETRKDMEVYRTTVQKLQDENTELKRESEQRENLYRSKLQDVVTAHTNDLNTTVVETTRRVEDQYLRERLQLTSSLSNAREAYTALEDEYKKSVDAQTSKMQELHTTVQNLTQLASNQEQMLSKSSQTEAELTELIQELTTVVKEQKRGINDLMERNSACSLVFEDKVQMLEDKLRSAQQFKHDAKDKLKAFELLQTAYAEKDAKLQKLLGEKGLADGAVMEKNLLQDQEILKMRCQLKYLEEEKEKLEKKVLIESDSVKVKNKMLDDQNETIRNLKQSLQAKVTECKAAVDDALKREMDAEERLSDQVAACENLHHELKYHEKVIRKLESRAEKYDEERDGLQSQITLLSTKLKERSERIMLIEEEVSRVKSIFQAKEQKIVAEHDRQLKHKDSEISRLKTQEEALKLNLSISKQEQRETMNHLKELESEFDIQSKQKSQCEAEMKILLSEMDRQKAKMEDRLCKLKEAFDDG